MTREEWSRSRLVYIYLIIIILYINDTVGMKLKLKPPNEPRRVHLPAYLPELMSDSQTGRRRF